MGIGSFFNTLFGAGHSSSSANQTTQTATRAAYVPPQTTYMVQPQTTYTPQPQPTYTAPQKAASGSSSSGSAGGGNWFDQIDNSIVDHADHDLTVYDPQRKPVTFSPDSILASGGEGTVYDLPGGKFVAKIFKPETLGKHEKMKEIRARISDMLRLETSNGLGRCSWLAWPRMALFNAKGELIGYVMNKVSGTSFRTLGGGPVQVSKCFPRWNRMNLYLTALDLVKKIK